MKSEFFINVTHRGMTVHMLRGAGKKCLSGAQRIPAKEADMGRNGEVEILRDKPYRIWTCSPCWKRYRMFLEAGK